MANHTRGARRRGGRGYRVAIASALERMAMLLDRLRAQHPDYANDRLMRAIWHDIHAVWGLDDQN
jgi:hypothetical protein